MQSFKVNDNEAGQRLDKLLFKQLNKAPKSFIFKMLRKKNITLNDKKAKGSEKVNIGDDIKMFLSDETIAKFSEEVEISIVEQEFSVIYEDDNILVVNKPTGLLSQKAEDIDVSLNEQIISYLLTTKSINKQDLQTFKPSICNRLDRNTSGLIIAGKSLIGLQTISGLFHDRLIEKYYISIVLGNLKEKMNISGYITKDETNNKAEVSPNQTKDSEEFAMEYKPINNKHDFSLIQIKLITGKTHQIRAHLASIGHPIIGDYKYGDRKTNDIFKRKYNLKHQLLHSQKLTFPQVTGELSNLSNKTFESSPPLDFAKIQGDLF